MDDKILYAVTARIMAGPSFEDFLHLNVQISKRVISGDVTRIISVSPAIDRIHLQERLANKRLTTDGLLGRYLVNRESIGCISKFTFKWTYLWPTLIFFLIHGWWWELPIVGCPKIYFYFYSMNHQKALIIRNPSVSWDFTTVGSWMIRFSMPLQLEFPFVG